MNICRYCEKEISPEDLTTTHGYWQGLPAKTLVNMGYFRGHCLKFDKPTIAQPKTSSGLNCFEHRKS